MEKHYDVGIYGLWYGNNYGSIITYYALTKVLEEMGKTYAMIRNPLGKEADISQLRRSHPLRFATDHYDITPLYHINEMSKLNDTFDSFLLGSDQMWNYALSKPYKQSYFFDFVNDDKIKLAYATSFGRNTYKAPEEERIITEKNLHRFNAISVRDDFSKKICEEQFHVPSTIVLDPVFLCSQEKYDALTRESDLSIEGGYIFAYILDPNKDIGSSIEKIAQFSEVKVIVVFNESGDKEKCWAALEINSDYVEYITDPTVQEWLYLYKNSKFVITDSFHGVCFSIIYQKQFVVLKNVKRGGNRFDYLLNEFGLLDYMVEKPELIVKKFFVLGFEHRIDYDAVYERIKAEGIRSRKWLKDALIELPVITSNKKTGVKASINALMDAVDIPMNHVAAKLDQSMCTGCSACVNACPKEAMLLKTDIHGYYRAKIDSNRCSNCGLCARICPALRLPEKKNLAVPALYEFITSDEEILYKSSSGGVFALLAMEAFQKGGVVVGAAWREDYGVEHIIIEGPQELYRLQKSKYVQSCLGDIFQRTKGKLEEGRFVLFSGCPCQIAGFKAFLGKEYENLLLVDLLCGNAPSALFFQKYLKEDFPDGVEKYEFRHKVQGWRADCITTTTNGITFVRRGGKQDNYQRVYHNHTMCPPHCEKCSYQAVPRFGDITIGDFWRVDKKDREVDVKKGISAVLVNNEKGKDFFLRIPEEKVKVRKQTPLDWLGGNGNAIHGSRNWCSPKRDLFYEAILKMPFSKAVTYALKPNHGEYPKKGLFGYRAADVHFQFDPSVWEEHYINGVTVLSTRPERPKAGNYCTLPLNQCLEAGTRYKFQIRFEVQTEDSILNFHVKDAGSQLYQVIYSHPVTADNRGRWVTIEKEFTPDCGFYDEFMIGAAQLRGPKRYLAIEQIGIEKAYEIT